MTETATKQRFGDLSFKDKSAYITAIMSFCLGWILLFTGVFIPPVGEIAPSVLSGFGLALVYTAGIFGVYLYIKGSSAEMYTKLMDKISDELASRLDKGKENEK